MMFCCLSCSDEVSKAKVLVCLSTVNLFSDGLNALVLHNVNYVSMKMKKQEGPKKEKEKKPYIAVDTANILFS